MKKETLQEASQRYSYGGREGGHRTPFLEGVKWQMERSYSEEEVLPLLEMLQKCKEYFLLQTSLKSEERADAIAQLIETFKKK